LVAEKDAVGLAAALLKLTANRELWLQLGQAASTKVSERFEHGQQVGRLEAAYREALEIWRDKS
jgi:glycosyltransferase involved in cell wall biosynthesis